MICAIVVPAVVCVVVIVDIVVTLAVDGVAALVLGVPVVMLSYLVIGAPLCLVLLFLLFH